MKLVTTFKEWRKVAGMVFVLVLLIICIATLLTSDDAFVAVRSLFFIILLTIIARRFLR